MSIILALVGVFVGTMLGETEGALIGGAIGFLFGLGLAKRRSGGPAFNAEPDPLEIMPRSAESTGTASSRSNVGLARRVASRGWIAPGQAVTIAGTTITSGLVYVADGVAGSSEPSVIDPQLRAEFSASGDAPSLPHAPDYETLGPRQRGVYLQWLARGRRDDDPAQRDVGCVFLFFYGLERRVLIDGDVSDAIGEELAALLELYAPHARSRSLPTCLSQLLHFWAFHQGPEAYARRWPWILARRHGVLDPDELQLVTGSLAAANRNAPARVAREIAAHSAGAVAGRAADLALEELHARFDERFVDAFPHGLPLIRGEAVTTASYLPANPALRAEAEAARGRFVARTIAVSVSLADRQRLVELWNECCAETAPRPTSQAAPDTAPAGSDFSAVDLRGREARAADLGGQLDELLRTAPEENGCFFVPVSAVAGLFGIGERERCSLTQSRHVAEALEELGWLFEPDPRTHGARFSDGRELVVFRGDALLPSMNFLGHCALVQMSVALAVCDGWFDRREREAIAEMIETSATSRTEKARLRAWALLLGRDIANAPASLTQVARAVPADDAPMVARLLRRVAMADHVVTKSEERMLEWIFHSLGLENEGAAGASPPSGDFDEVLVTREGEPLASGGVLSVRVGRGRARFKLGGDERKSSGETAAVIQILSGAMAAAGLELEKAALHAKPAK